MRLHVLAALLLVPLPAQAQATARYLEVVAEDGTVVRIGQVTGAIEVEPSADPAARFGAVHVRAGLVIEARATDDSEIPIWARGTLGPLRASGRGARLDALHRAERGLVARLVVGDTVFSDVPIRRSQWVIAGGPPLGGGVTWGRAPSSVAAGDGLLCAAPGGRCVALSSTVAIPVRVLGRRGAWEHVRAVSGHVTVDGWMREPRLVPTEDQGLWLPGEPGELGCACPSEGVPARVAPGTSVRLSPDGPIWARVADVPGPMTVRDSGGPWIEVHLAEGMQIGWPSPTCSLGWVPRDTVTLLPADA